MYRKSADAIKIYNCELCTICGTSIPCYNVFSLFSITLKCIAQQIQWKFENRPVDNLSPPPPPRKKKKKTKQEQRIFRKYNKSHSVYKYSMIFICWIWSNERINESLGLFEHECVTHFHDMKKKKKKNGKHNEKQIKPKASYK